MNDQLLLYANALNGDISLEHHGIKGQSWGKKNGPPYPLGSEDLSPAERKENPKGSNEQQKAELKKAAKPEESKSLRKYIKDAVDKRAAEKAKKEAQKKREATIAAKRKAAEEAEAKEKQRLENLNTFSAKELLEHRNEYSKEEIKSAIERLTIENNLRQVAVDEARKTNDEYQQKLDRMSKEQTEHELNIKNANRGADAIGVVTNYGEKAIKLYNVVALISGHPTLEDRAKLELERIKKEMTGGDKKSEKDLDKEVSKYANLLAGTKEDSASQKILSKFLSVKYKNDSNTLSSIASESDKVRANRESISDSKDKRDQDKRVKDFKDQVNTIVTNGLSTGEDSTSVSSALNSLLTQHVSQPGNSKDADILIKHVSDAVKTYDTMNTKAVNAEQKAKEVAKAKTTDDVYVEMVKAYSASSGSNNDRRAAAVAAYSSFVTNDDNSGKAAEAFAALERFNKSHPSDKNSNNNNNSNNNKDNNDNDDNN